MISVSVILIAIIALVLEAATPASATQTMSSGPDAMFVGGQTLDAPSIDPQPSSAPVPVSYEESMLGEAAIPEFTATAGLAVDITTGAVLYQYQPDVAVAPASTLKIVTALTALTVLDPDEVIEVLFEDLVDTEIYSNAQLQQGDLVSVGDLLAGLMIPSGGDAARTLARVAGERLVPESGQSAVDRFVGEMNRVAVSIGMQNSNFINPDGPDHPAQFTTARDMAIAGTALMEDRLLADIVARQTHVMTIDGPNARSFEVVNTNAFLGIDRVHGIKTGTTGQAGESIILATRRRDNQVITVVMGSEERYADTQLMLQYIDSRVRWVEFGASDDFPGVRSAAERFDFVLAVPLVRPMLNGDANRLHSELSLGPRPRGTLPVRWGHVVFLQDGQELYRIPVLRAGNGR